MKRTTEIIVSLIGEITGALFTTKTGLQLFTRYGRNCPSNTRAAQFSKLTKALQSFRFTLSLRHAARERARCSRASPPIP